ncbi:MAG: sigma factor [Deltaproteobacteria bacterium]|nr:sigma factor [Deltaproteobacteria bacterium]
MSGMSHHIESGSRPAEDVDRVIVARCQKGDVQAFESLVEKYQKKMLNTAYRMIGDYQEACEVTQEAFLSAYRGIKKFRGEATFTTWMTGIVLNQARNRLKQMKTRSRYESVSLDVPVESPEGMITREVASEDCSASEQLEKKDTARMIQDCLNDLDPEFREVVVLREIQGYSYDEIRGILDLPEGTVKSRLFRAREILKGILKKRMGGQG